MMLQDLTKSAVSLSWALSLLGVKQAVSMMQSGQPGGNVFAPLAQAASEQLDNSMKELYRSGDNIQARVVDVAFTLVNPGNWSEMAAKAGMPGVGGANPPAPDSGFMGSMASMMNPMNWMNPMNLVREMQNCASCGQQKNPGQQP